MLTRIDTDEFTIYTHTPDTYEPDDEAARLKYIRNRNKLAWWFERVLADREVIVSWSEGSDMFSVTASLKTQNYNNLPPLPVIDPHHDWINKEPKPGTTHIAFYAKPEMVPVKLELDLVINMIVRRQGLDDIIKA